MNLRYPNITGKTPLEQISQLRSFLYQLVDQLNVWENGGLTIVQQNGATGAQTPGGTAQVSPQGSTPMSTLAFWWKGQLIRVTILESIGMTRQRILL